MPRHAALAALAAAVAIFAAGCGAVEHLSATEGDASTGKALFAAKCSSCHVLADAKAQGKVGPNLDEAFGPDRQQGFDESTIKDVVRGQIAYPEEPMPANIYEGEEADDVAAYVAKCAGVPACGVQAAGTAPAETKPPEGGGGGGGGGGGEQAQGKRVFTSNCGSCHTLKDAGTSGNVGPNLDQLKPPQPVVKRQVTNGGGGMPAFKGQLSEAQIDAVAAYVAGAAGK
jgi:mono/diheme cytochrome c family protein